MSSTVGELRGFCYVADTAEYVSEALRSLASLKEQMPNARVAFIAPRELFRPDAPIDAWIELPIAAGGPIVKSAAYLAPFERVVFLDTDTFITDDLSSLFNILDVFDFALAHEPTRGWDYPSDVPPSFCELNTGVIAFRNNPKTRAFFDRWRRCYESILSQHGLKNDQPAFRSTLWSSPEIRHATLPNEYNMVCHKGAAIAWKALVLHGRGDIPAIAADINRKLGIRVILPGIGAFSGFRGRRFWIADYLRLSLGFLRVLFRPSLTQPGKSPVIWW